MKKIAFLISGKIRIYEKNLVFLDSLRKKFENYEIIFVSSVWENQETINEFQQKYKIKFINQIKEKNWQKEIDKIKFVTGDENLSFKIENVYHMWDSIIQNILFLEEIKKKNNIDFDYVCRFRTDITTLKNIKNLRNDLERLKNGEILFSSNRHFRGITDLFFIANFQTFIRMKNFLNYLEKFNNEGRVFNPEYIFYSFVSENNFRIKIAYKLDIALIRIEEAKPTKKVFVPFNDKLNMKLAKRKIKIIKFLNKLSYIWNK